MERLRIGVVGLRFGEHHVRTLVDMDDVELVAVADRNSRPGGVEALARALGARVYRDGVEMMEREKLDAVTLCVSPRAREALVEAAARLGIPMFVEKPWATDLDQARRLPDVCRRHRATVMVGFSFRFHPAIVRLRQLIESDLGTPWMLNGQYVFDWIPPRDSWLWDPQNGNGFFNENSCHLFDSVCYLLGRPVSVTAEGGSFTGSPSEDAAALTLRFESGAIAALTVGGIGVKGFRRFPRIDVVTERGQAALRGLEHMWTELTWTLRGDPRVQSVVSPPELLGKTRYTDALRHFVACVRSGEQPSAGIEDGMRTVALAEAVYESARTGTKVNIKE